MHLCPQQGLGRGERNSTSSLKLLSCSKDCSVALTVVRSTGIEVVRTWEDVHEGVVKAVRWRDSQQAATCGNDRCEDDLQDLCVCVAAQQCCDVDMGLIQTLLRLESISGVMAIGCCGSILDELHCLQSGAVAGSKSWPHH
jgi:hypothetical protein